MPIKTKSHPKNVFVLMFSAQCAQWHCLFVCYDALHPKSTAMVMPGRSVHLTTLFPGQA